MIVVTVCPQRTSATTKSPWFSGGERWMCEEMDRNIYGLRNNMSRLYLFNYWTIAVVVTSV